MRVLALVAVCCAGAPTALAQPAQGTGEADASLRDEEARTLFRAGRLAYADGRYGDALDAFEKSYELSGKPALLFNIGAALDRLRRNEEAIEAYERYLEERPEAGNRGAVEARLEALRRAVERERRREAELRAAAKDREALEVSLTQRERELAEREQESIARKWWFWTVIGVVVVGGVTTAALLARDRGVEGPELGSTGQVFFTLGSEP